MSPRAYRLGKREPALQRNKENIVAVAGQLLRSEGFHRMSVEAVAEAAGVTRVTVYNQFGSKLGLLEAVFDEMGRQGESVRIRQASELSDARQALREVVHATCSFWDSDRELFSRLIALAQSDPETGQVIESRENLRRHNFERLTVRLDSEHRLRPGFSAREAMHALLAITQFTNFELLTRLERAPAPKVAQLICRIASSVVDWGDLELGAPFVAPR